MTKILLGAPVRDRAWILPRFIEHVKQLNLTSIELDSLFLVNDCSDNTRELLTEANFNVIEYSDLDTKTQGSIRGQYSYLHLANLRNAFVEEFLKTDNEYLFSIDTDILLTPDTLQKLVANKLDICSAILCNQQGQIGHRAHNIMLKNKDTALYHHILSWVEGDIVPVDLTGAVYLIHRSVLEAGVRYAEHIQGEDIPFCRTAQEKGFGIFCDTSIKPTHVMGIENELIGGC